MVKDRGCSEPPKPGWRRRDDARVLGQPVEHRRVGIEADAGMEEQQRPPAAALHAFHRDAIDRERRKRVLYCHRLRPTLRFPSHPVAILWEIRQRQRKFLAPARYRAQRSSGGSVPAAEQKFEVRKK